VEQYDLTPGLRQVGYGPPAPRSMLFAGTVLGLIGTFNAIAGIGVLSGSRVYAAHGVFEFGNARVWGWVVLLAGVAELVASFAIFSKSSVARWFGVCAAGANAFTQLLAVPAHPLWALAAVAADLVVIRVLVLYGGRGWASR
jgi:hypothetical protein